MRYARAYPNELPQLVERLAEINAPVLIIAGRRDRVVPLINAEFLDERLPNGKLVVVEAGHFVWEERADVYASLTADWGRGRVPRGGGTWADRGRDVTSNRRR
jgi:pimeloyl-ACP methyl ester carboxylesterase